MQASIRAVPWSPASRRLAPDEAVRVIRRRCARLEMALGECRAEVARLQSILTASGAASGPLNVWVAGKGGEPYIGYRREGRVFVPGIGVIEDVDVLHTAEISD